MAGPLLDRVATDLRRRIGTPSARYRLALSSGFVIASIGMGSVVIGQSGQAEDFFSALGHLFSAPQQAAPQTYATGSVYHEVHRAPRRVRYVEDDAPRVRRKAERHRGATRAKAVATSVTAEGGSQTRLGHASMCVRLCDGFAFPVGDFHGEGDLASHEATCRSECPGAKTALYVLPNGSSSIDEAVEARTGLAYSHKASGFHYTTYIDESCSCHPQGGNRIASLLHDFTLRRGDAVVTPSGVTVFHGAAHFPYRQADFVRLAKSRDVRKTARATFHAIERASVTSTHPAVAQAAAKPVSRKAAGLNGLEHQASLSPSDTAGSASGSH